mmetsp:Transcript_117071/g.164592  ORF Transcript_117071/g.164592 Transcript_117071/m.164592 type:complete len:129 (+) Transcript_117071:377-763(+)
MDHPNIIKIHDASASNERLITKEKIYSNACPVVVMEFAPYGDFVEAVESFNFAEDEKLCRTYFHQLIAGLEHLHKNGVAHTDLKLENLLIGDEFKLKIADFDLCFKHGDKNIRSRGTKYYRAPEMIEA